MNLRRLTPTGGVSTHGLPSDILEVAVRRLGFLGLIIALMGPSAYLIERWTQPGRVVVPDQFPFQTVAAAVLFAAGAVVCSLAWSRKVRAELMTDLGLIFEVLVAFAISLSENATPWQPEDPIRGISWICLCISMYVIAIPGTYGKSVLAAVAAACMAPFGLLVATSINGIPLPTAKQSLVLLLPPFVAAAWAIPVARHLNRLGAQVRKARIMGSYELLELIGKGGMGEVWRAKHRMLARAAAIKLVRPEVFGVERPESAQVALRRFEREARITASLRSPHTVVLYDYGFAGDGSFYYVMELLEGLDLESLVNRFGAQPAERVIFLLRQAAKSLLEAHEHGLVHRDVKPRNIFCCRMAGDDDFVKVLDFGLVKVRTSEETQTQLTRTGETTGTPAFMAPEAATGRPDVDARADLYSLGCVGYWLLTRQLVFEASSVVAMILAHVQTPPTPPSQRTALPVPASLENAVLRCLEKDPARRPQSARELIGLLDVCSEVEPWTQDRAEGWWQVHMAQEGAGRAEPAVMASGETM